MGYESRKSSREWTAERLMRLNDAQFERLLLDSIGRRSNLNLGEVTLQHQSADSPSTPNLELLFKEAQRRGRSVSHDANLLVKRALDGKGFLRNTLNPTAARAFELGVSECVVKMLTSQGVAIDKREVSARVVGKYSGRVREVDLLLVRDMPRHAVAVEIKSQKTRIGIEVVESFVSKVQDVDADRGAFVSRAGYEKGAVAIARARNIPLFTCDQEPRAEVLSRWKESEKSLGDNLRFWVLQDLDGHGWVFGKEDDLKDQHA